jgi:hypothetical protein
VKVIPAATTTTNAANTHPRIFRIFVSLQITYGPRLEPADRGLG